VAFRERKEARVEVVEGFHPRRGLVQGPEEEEEEGRKEMVIVG
jgi:hypothetical protein